MRLWPLGWILLLTVACGCGAAMEGGPAAAPGMPAPVVAQPPAPERDRDADGIPDKADKCPDNGGDDGCGTPGSLGASGGAGDAAIDAQVRDPQKLIYMAHLTLAVFQVEAALGKVEAIAREAGGYLSSRADREITIRVPRGRFDESIKRIEGTGDVLHRDIKAQDVTDEFFDLELRLKNARVMRDRLILLLAKAAVKDAIEIEKELGRVTESIERMEGQLKLLRVKIAFSTITVSLEPTDTNPVAKAVPLPFPWLSELGLAHLLSVHP